MPFPTTLAQHRCKAVGTGGQEGGKYTEILTEGYRYTQEIAFFMRF